jgi:glycosyltransferase involved in cell wall biosynthesis
MPVFNKGPHLQRSISSVLRQSEPDFELIIVDDGSTDDGPRQLEALDDERVRVAHRDGPGPGASPARNLGVALANAAWLAFLDADDEWHEDFLRSITATREAFPYARMVSTGWIKKEPGGARSENAYYKTNRERGPHAYGLVDYLTSAAGGATPVWTSAAAVDRETLVAGGAFPEGAHALRGEDEDTWLRVMFEGERAAWAPVPGAIHHRDAVNRLTRKAAPDLSRVPLLETLDARLATETGEATRAALEAYRRSVKRRARRDVAEQRFMNACTAMFGEARVNRWLERHFSRRARRAGNAGEPGRCP